MKRRVVAAALIASIGLAGCGGSSGSSESESSQESSTTAAASGNPSLLRGRELTCTGDGISLTVTYGNTREAPLDLVAGWLGEADGATSVSYILTIAANGVQRQAAFKRIVGTGEIFQFLYDLNSSQQTDIKPPDASQAAMVFPNALAGVDGDWSVSGVVSVDGQDLIACP